MDKFGVIMIQIEKLGEQRDRLLLEFERIDFSNMQAFTRKNEFDMQIKNIDARIDALLDKLSD